MFSHIVAYPEFQIRFDGKSCPKSRRWPHSRFRQVLPAAEEISEGMEQITRKKIRRCLRPAGIERTLGGLPSAIVLFHSGIDSTNWATCSSAYTKPKFTHTHTYELKSIFHRNKLGIYFINSPTNTRL